MTTYQKQKARIKQLESDIYKIIMEKDLAIEEMYRFRFRVSESALLGSKTPEQARGLLQLIDSNNG